MKYLFTLFLAVSLISCSQETKQELTKQQKAELKIKDWLFKNLNDTTGYQSVEFDSIQNDSTSFIDTSIVPEVSDKLRREFKPEFTGFKINHKFRAKNAIGATIINNYTFHLDTALNIESVDK